jgi:signal transduction histidine kinase/DNA-binding response OmpR family regulator
MGSENNIIILLSLTGLFILLFILTQQHSKQKLKHKIVQLEDIVAELMTQLKNKKQTTQLKPQSALHLEYIKKIEALEDALQIEKRKLAATKAIAQEANRVKSEFLSNIRHEIRTPMNSIMAFSNLLSQELKDEKLQSYTKNIESSGEALLTLLDDIIELSNVEKGSFKIDETPVDIRRVLFDVSKQEREKALQKGLTFSIDVDENVPEILLLDKEKVEEILLNLISNAVRSTKEGFVTVTLFVEKEKLKNNTVDVVFSIKDSGVGIEAVYLEKIFEIFEKTEGLGLSINRKIARAMNGDIIVVSKPNEGSQFQFILRDVEVALKAKRSDEQWSQENIDFSLLQAKYHKVVLIDRDTETKENLKAAFSKSSFELFCFTSPRDAVAFLSKNMVDIIFVDIDVLTEDENAFAKILTGLCSAPIISVTSKRIKNVDLTADMNLSGHIIRPIGTSELFKTALRAINSKKEQSHQINSTLSGINEVLQNCTQEQRDAFLRASENQLESLYMQAWKTNDLESIKQFAQTLFDVAQSHNMESFTNFAKKLLGKIDLFDIEAIQGLMAEYQEKITILKNL